jgi:hypothetical protein
MSISCQHIVQLDEENVTLVEVLFWLKWCNLATLPILGSEVLKIGKIIRTDGFVRILHGRQKISQCDITGYNLKREGILRTFLF